MPPPRAPPPTQPPQPQAGVVVVLERDFAKAMEPSKVPGIQRSWFSCKKPNHKSAVVPTRSRPVPCGADEFEALDPAPMVAFCSAVKMGKLLA